MVFCGTVGTGGNSNGTEQHQVPVQPVSADGGKLVLLPFALASGRPFVFTFLLVLLHCTMLDNVMSLTPSLLFCCR